jgi:hypothetical protein
MKTTIFVLLLMLFISAPLHFASAQEETTIIAPTVEVASGLDLQAVGELFKEAETLENFEKSLNDTTIGVNNLDLDEDGYVDYIRVVEQSTEDAHLVILQALLGEDDSQDVATIEVEKSGDDEYNMQVQGDERVYGPNYYVAPVHVHVHAWPLVGWMYGPYYRPYRSRFHFGFYPRWYHPYHPVPVHHYHTRVVHYSSRSTFRVTRTSHVHTRTRVNYTPRSSTSVKRRTVTTSTPAKRSTSRTTTIKRKNKSTTVGVKRTTNPRTGKKSTSVGAKKTTKTKDGKRSVTRGARKRSDPAKGKSTVTRGSKKTKSTPRGNKTTDKKRTTTRDKR